MRVGDHSSHVAPRSCTEERGLPPVQYPVIMRRPITTSTARRARAESSRISPHPKRTSAQWCLSACHVNAGCALEITARTSHHGLAPKERGMPPMQHPFAIRRSNTVGAARRARTARSPISSPPDRQPVQWGSFACYVNSGCALEVTALSSHHGLAPKERGLQPVQYLFTVRKSTTTSAAWRARAKRLRVSPTPGQWRLFACHMNASSALEITARTSHHDLASEEIGLPPVQYPFLSRSTIATSAARPARAASSRVSPHPERTSAQWRLSACHVNAGCALKITARTSHHGLTLEERGLPPVQHPFIMRKPITASAARRARAASSRISPPPERPLAQWRSSAVPRECRLRVGDHSSHVAPRSYSGGERSFAGVAPFHNT